MKKIKSLLLIIAMVFFSQYLYAESKVLMQTNVGDIEIVLDEKNAPISSANFIDYVNTGFYDGLIFHRVIPNFMIQGGGADSDLRFKKTQQPIKNEANNGLNNDRGTIAMARTSDINSATSQFFINVVNNDFLNYKSDDNYGYAVFGKVTKGMDIIDQMMTVKTVNKGPHQNVPAEPITIIKATVIEE